jgi:glycogen operon protein
VAAGRVTAGSPEPLGVTPTAGGANVAVFSSTATAIDLCLFDQAGGETRVRLPERTGGVFHGHVEGVVEGDRYGLRAHGPSAPERGQRFDAGKLLVDPYAQALDRRFELHPSLFAPPEAGLDTAAHVPKALVTAPAPPAGPLLIHPWDRTIIYEAHVRGLSMRHPDVPEAIRGTFAGLGHPAIVQHLVALGVTTLELLPVAAWIDERHLPPLGLSNYWGYNPIAFCAPDPKLAPGGWTDVRAAVAALAAAGIEVILDVVFNHTGESDELGPTLSLRGLDNAGYYRLAPQDPSRYVNDAGTGNILACDRPQTVRLVTEAMRTWARRTGVAGFRFDLATVLARRQDGFDPNAPLLAAIDQDPELRGLKLIAEPWDCGPGGYQLGRFPGGWAEWNDRFRDTVRRGWRGAGASLGEMAGRLCGSPEAFAPRHRPSRSVNFVTAHDGFTLADLTAYEHKHNQANGEANRDGSDHDGSWNSGVEGATDDPAIRSRRLADQRALLALLLAARGTPMLAMGAEFGQSQGGNNNAYAQDNALTWLDWEGADRDLAAFTAKLCAARREHPALRADRFVTGYAEDGPWPDVEWRNAEGGSLSPHEWDDPAGPVLQMVLAAPTPDGEVDRTALLINRGESPRGFRLPAPRDRKAWRVLADSADPGREGLADEIVEAAARSVLLVAETASRRPAAGAPDEAVAALADAAGVARTWWSLDGEAHAVSPATQRALLAAMSLPAQTADDVAESLWRLTADARAALPAVQLVGADTPVTLRMRGAEAWLMLQGPEGLAASLQIADGVAQLPALPPGRYRLEAGAHSGELIVAPKRGFEPAALAAGGRIFGFSAQLYSLRRKGDGGLGDFTTLGQLGDLAAQAGAALIALNPLHALYPADRERASPYYPSDRRFMDPLYLDTPGPTAAPTASAIDYPAAWAAKSAALAEAADHAIAEDPAGFAAFVADEGQALADFCAFQALQAALPGAWRDWPQALRDPGSAEVAAFAAANAQAVRREQALQWLCDQGLAAAAAQAPGLGLCRDLAVGAAPDGAEAWSKQGLLARGVSIGAPPDALAPQGQVWGLPPPDPNRWRAEAYRSFGELIAANMRHAGALRIDHVLGLARLFWVPEGADGADGAYVAYPLRDLLGVLALESQHARCLVIGEDLGTVPEGLREALGEAGVYRYSVMPFERDGDSLRRPAHYPARALACASTHDLPPLAGWWAGADNAEREALGLVTGEAAKTAQEERAVEKRMLLAALAAEGLGAADWTEASPFSDALSAAVHAYVARAESRIVLVQIDDLAGERVGVNLPGTDQERPNWRRRLAPTLDELSRTPLFADILDAVRQERAAPR